MKKATIRCSVAVLLVLVAIVPVLAKSNEVNRVLAENESRILLLEQALRPRDPYATVEAWAEGVKTRNGALQYAVMSQDLKEDSYTTFSGLNWVTGVSSPWIEKYQITEKYQGSGSCLYEVVFMYNDSTKSSFEVTKYVTVASSKESWLISSIETVDIMGEIGQLLLGEAGNIDRFYVEESLPQSGSYDKANVIVGAKTKIFDGFTDRELTETALQTKATVLVSFTDDPRIMIYPVLAEAKVIRVIGDDPSISEIQYDNSEYGFSFLLPGSWEGYSIVEKQWEGFSVREQTEKTQTGPIINIRHPLWTVEMPRQDIPIMVFTTAQWVALLKEEFHIGAAPIGPKELGRNKNYVFALPARYNYAFPEGFEEVGIILEATPLKPF